MVSVIHYVWLLWWNKQTNIWIFIFTLCLHPDNKRQTVTAVIRTSAERRRAAETSAAGTWRQDIKSMQMRNDEIPLWAIGGQIFSPYVLLLKLLSTLVPVKPNLSIPKYQNTPCSQSISPCRTVRPCLFTEIPQEWINHFGVTGGHKDTWCAVSQLLVKLLLVKLLLEGIKWR